MAEPCGCKARCGALWSMQERSTALAHAFLAAAQSEPAVARFGTSALGHAPLPADFYKLLAISQAESSGYEKACHTNSDGSIDRGLWQINSSHGFGASSYDGTANATQAVAVYKSQGLRAWTTYTSGRYLLYLAQARRAGAADYQAGNGPGEQGSKPAGCVYDLNLGLAHFCVDPIFGGAKIAAGGAGLMLLGLALIALLSRNVVAPVAGIVASRSPAGRLATAASPRARTERRETAQADTARRRAPIEDER